MAEIVNLNKARKAWTRAEAGKRAETNRAKFGRTRAEKDRDAAEQSRRDALLDGAKREDQ